MKGTRTILYLSLVSLINLLPLFFTSDSMNSRKVDIYLFADHERYPENIAYDISEIVSIVIFIYVIYRLVPELKYRRYVFAFLVSALLSMGGYFLFYSQYVSLFLIPILIALLFYTYYYNEKRNNVG